MAALKAWFACWANLSEWEITMVLVLVAVGTTTTRDAGFGRPTAMKPRTTTSTMMTTRMVHSVPNIPRPPMQVW
jgi:hypothetical protein